MDAPTSSMLFDQAQALNAAGERREALELFLRLADGRAGPVAPPLARRALRKGMLVALKLEDLPAIEALARQAVLLSPGSAEAHWCQGESLWRKGEATQARAELERAIALKPGLPEARSTLALIQAAARRRPRAARPWPAKQSQFDDLGKLIDQYLLRGRPDDRFITSGAKFFTLGSCFAGNLASRLRERGYQVHWEDVGEDVNSTFANRALMDWVEHGPHDQPTSVMDEFYGAQARERLRQAVHESEVFVMTLGVAACFFHDDTGDFAFLPMRTRAAGEALMGGHVMRTTTVAENVANIGAILDAVGRLARRPPRIVLTVSPVPLAGTSEMVSAITADALSKSTLLLACHEAVTARAAEQVVYWPSFEVARWLGAHLGQGHSPAYGADDGHSRHVSGWMVDLIIDKFLQHHAEA